MRSLAILSMLALSSWTTAQAQARRLPVQARPQEIVVVAIVKQLADPSARATVIRHQHGEIRNLVLLKDGYVTPLQLAAALRAVSQRRRHDGVQPNFDGVLQMTHSYSGRQIPPEQQRLAVGYLRLLRKAPVVHIDEVGDVQAMFVRLRP